MQQLETEFVKVPARDTAIEQYLIAQGIANVQGSPEGFYFSIDQVGQGATAQSGDYVAVHYTGTRLDGVKFDSSVDRGEPFTFQIGAGMVIQGWDKGIPLFSVGSKGRLFLPPNMAYGAQGAGSDIGPNTPLVFEIEMLEVVGEEQMKELQAAQEEQYREAFMAQMAIDSRLIREYATQNMLLLQYDQWGIGYTMEREGSGSKVQPGQTAVVHYTGRLLNGQVFDSSLNRGQPIAVPVGAGRVIPGWDEGLQLFAVGGKGRLYIPSSLAYGEEGAGNGIIPPDANLIFDIEVLGIQ